MNIHISQSQAPRCFLMAALVLLGLTYFIMLFYRGFFDPDEGRYAEIPREMVTTGHWGEIRMLGYAYYEKPPLAYWMVAPAIKVFGAREWAVRIPLFLNIVLLAGLLYALVRRHWPGAPGRSALLVMLSLIGFVVGFCLLLTDGFLTFWFSLTCILLFLAFQKEARPAHQYAFLFLAAIAAVLGVLTKGAIAVVLPGGILFFWLLWERRLRAMLTAALPLAGLLFIVLLTPIMYWIEQHNPGFIRHFIFEEHLARFLGTRASQLHDEPFWFFAAVLMPLLLPWTLFLVRAIRTIIVRRLLTTDALTRFFTVWAAVVIVFFSIGTGKLMSYIMPAIPPLGLLLGRWGLVEPLDGTRRDRQLWKLGMAGPLITALAIILLWLISFFQVAPELVYPVSAISGVALIPLIAGFGIMLWRRGFHHFYGMLFFNAMILLTAALLLSPLAGKDFNVLLHINSSHVYKKLAGILKPEDHVVVFWDHRPALPFYTQRITYPFQVKNELEYGIYMDRERKCYLHYPDELKQLIQHAPGRVYGVVDPNDYDKRFLPLKLNFVPVDFPKDPDTVILELLPQRGVSP